ncbi:MAG: hypothetical protein EAZ18_20865, partial [Oscillatoriales cyanobacterium]
MIYFFSVSFTTILPIFSKSKHEKFDCQQKLTKKRFYEQAVRPVPQRVDFIVEQAGQPVTDTRCLFHKEWILLW